MRRVRCGSDPMLKFLLITFLVLWLSIKLAGFVIRMFLRSSGFTVTQNGRGRGPSQARNPQAASPEPKGHVTDNLGEYVDFEEVK